MISIDDGLFDELFSDFANFFIKIIQQQQEGQQHRRRQEWWILQ